MDFIRVAFKENQDGTREFYPSLLALDSQDLVIRGGQLVAVWDEDRQLYSRRISHAPTIIDRAFARMVEPELRSGDVVKRVVNFNNQIWQKFLSLTRSIGDVGPELDQRLVFADQTPCKEDAATFVMPYSLSDGPAPAWEEICTTLYDPEERTKFEWAIGSILAGQAGHNIQKFYVFFGPPGSGKSTIMNVIEWIFEGHTAAFSAYDMGKADAQFSLEPFKNNPLVAIDQDGDLSRLELNKNLNSITSHDKVLINAKGKSLYEIIPRATLFIGSNEAVKISNRKSGLFRRLVDIQPTGNLIDEERYHILMAQVKFEIGQIANHCLNVFLGLGPTYLSLYRATDMMYRTNDIFNFVEDNRLILSQGVSLKQAHKLFVEWCNETDTRNVYKQYQFRDLLTDYFHEFHHEIMVEGVRHRSYFMGLRELEKFSWKGLAPAPPKDWLELEENESVLDSRYAHQPAQLSGKHGTPKQAWSDVSTTLADIDTKVEHYVQIPVQDIVIDFDLTDEAGNKSLKLNLEAAAKWPPTYAEVSKGGEGLHLHYEYDGDVERLAPLHEPGIEVKTLLGNASLRRRLSLNNTLAVATISSGLKLKKEKSVLAPKTLQSEKGLRELIVKALRKEINVGTKANMDFIEKVLNDAHESGMTYDVTDMWDDILGFAMGSTNQRGKSIEIAMALKLKSETDVEPIPDEEEKPLAYFDLEVYPNLCALGYMFDHDDAEVVKLINPTPQQVEEFITRCRIMGYNNRGYDNHILWALTLGYDNEALYDLSQAIIVHNNRERMFGAAYNLAYGDLYDIIVEKHSLKWWQIKLGLPHMEMDIPWDQPVPENRIQDVLDYLENDVRSTRAVAKHREGDIRARQILAELSGLAVCNTNRQHTERLIFGEHAKGEKPDLVYTDLREMFPGYEFDQFAPGKDKSTYRGYKVGEGGWVYSEPGMYEGVYLYDVASMHPTSIIQLNMFGEYTSKFKELMDQRLEAKRLGKTDPEQRALSDALKIVINSVYGLTAASFPNMFRDERNIDNIVAKRGALFMVDLKLFLEGEGYKVVHVKTDSVKVVIPEGTSPDPKILDDLIMNFGRSYGYEFEHEATYERFCLVNDAVYVARKDGEWSATGAQFQHPAVFKTLFTHEELEPRDYIEVKQVAKGTMWLKRLDDEHKTFVGKFGAFVPVLEGRQLLRIDGDKEHAVTGTKDHLWELDEMAFASEFTVDMSYFQKLIDNGRATIEKFGDYATFTRP